MRISKSDEGAPGRINNVSLTVEKISGDVKREAPIREEPPRRSKVLEELSAAAEQALAALSESKRNPRS